MATVVRPVTYGNALQRLVITSETAGTISVELWGGGGGGGGDDSGTGGNGSGSGYASVTFSAVAGDVVEVAVGGGGGGGSSRVGSAPGGIAGASYAIPTQIFNSLNPPAGQDAVYQVTNRYYCGFLNQYGVWNEPGGYSAIFDRTYTINAAVSGNYQIISSCDNYGTVSIDGTVVLNVNGFTSTYSTTVFLLAGNHTIRTQGTNTGGPGSMATTVSLESGVLSYSGGFGGTGGPDGSSGGGGGGGGATVVFKNGVIIAVAGGGAGGGGAGNQGTRNGDNAPALLSLEGTAGQNGQTKGPNNDGYTDGGGGGGGGGGNGGGNGGNTRFGDQGALAGSAGGGLGDSTANPTSIDPSVSCPYGAAGRGGITAQSGNNGIAVFTFSVYGSYIKHEGSWQPVQQTYVKDNDVWKSVQETWIKQNDQWQLIAGTNTTAPTFAAVSGNFGIDSRTYPPAPPPEF